MYVDVITLVSVLHIKSTAKVPYVASVYYTYKLRHKHFKTSDFYEVITLSTQMVVKRALKRIV
jgi:hypothetical protein